MTNIVTPTTSCPLPTSVPDFVFLQFTMAPGVLLAYILEPCFCHVPEAEMSIPSANRENVGYN